MPKSTRKSFALVPSCLTLDARLSPSGNVLAQGVGEVADALKHMAHRPAEHAPMGGETHAGGTHAHEGEHHHHHAK